MNRGSEDKLTGKSVLHADHELMIERIYLFLNGWAPTSLRPSSTFVMQIRRWKLLQKSQQPYLSPFYEMGSHISLTNELDQLGLTEAQLQGMRMVFPAKEDEVLATIYAIAVVQNYLSCLADSVEKLGHPISFHSILDTPSKARGFLGLHLPTLSPSQRRDRHLRRRFREVTTKLEYMLEELLQDIGSGQNDVLLRLLSLTVDLLEGSMNATELG